MHALAMDPESSLATDGPREAQVEIGVLLRLLSGRELEITIHEDLFRA